jgi:peptidylprolyl isomerase
MNRIVLAFIFAAAAFAASAQTPSKPSTPATPAPKLPSPTSAASTTKSSTAASAPAPWIKLPPGVPAVAHGPVRTSPIVVHYEEIKVGPGPEGAAGKVWHLKYTGWRAADGVKFDSWDEHPQPVMGQDGKPELGPDGKPKLEAQPAPLPQGIGAVIPGFDYGLAGMRIGGKRRIFIPWQLAYGMHTIPDHSGRPGIPAKSDLIFDVELVAVTDMPPPQPRPIPTAPPTGVPPHPSATPQPNAAPAPPATPARPAATAPAQPSAPAPSAKPAQPAAPAPPSTPAPATAPAQPQPK